jgi:hypothetical protein
MRSPTKSRQGWAAGIQAPAAPLREASYRVGYHPFDIKKHHRDDRMVHEEVLPSFCDVYALKAHFVY